MGLEVRSLDLSEIVRSSKQGVHVDKSGLADQKEHPLAGVTREQRNRNRDIGDVLNIGSGTRCTHCGFLHFLWRATCATCDKPMEYNLGHRDEANRA